MMITENNTETLQQSNVDLSLTNRAMLVSVTLSVWGGYKSDKRKSAEFAQSEGADPAMIRISKSLVDSPELEAIKKFDTKLRLLVEAYTLPWSKTGRLLSVDHFEKFMEIIRDRKVKRTELVNNFLEAYNQRVQEAGQEGKLGDKGLWKAEDYPTLEAMAKKFGFHVDISPIPVAGDLRVDMNNDLVNSIKNDLDIKYSDRAKSATKEVYSRLKDLVSHLLTSLEKYEVLSSPEEVETKTGRIVQKKVKNSFHESTITNIADFVNDMLPAFNVTNDPELTKLGKQIVSDLCLYNSKDLKVSTVVREDVISRASEILEKMKDYI